MDRSPPTFNLSRTFIIALIFVGLFITTLYLSAQNPLLEAEKDLLDKCNSGWQMGFAAIVGLIGGKIM